MAVFSALSSRRSHQRLREATQQLIVFRLFSERFALPIRSVQKVIPMGELYGASCDAGVSLTLYQDQELLVIDVKQRIFKGSPHLNIIPTGDQASSQVALDLTPHFLLVVQNPQGRLIGLPLSEPPTLQRVPESAFAPLTSAYISEGNIRCVSALVVLGKEKPPLFLLNSEQLVQSPPALPPSLG